jgi:hypothetical protein
LVALKKYTANEFAAELAAENLCSNFCRKKKHKNAAELLQKSASFPSHFYQFLCM